MANLDPNKYRGGGQYPGADRGLGNQRRAELQEHHGRAQHQRAVKSMNSTRWVSPCWAAPIIWAMALTERDTDAYSQEFQLSATPSMRNWIMSWACSVSMKRPTRAPPLRRRPVLQCHCIRPNWAFYQSNLTELLAKNSSASAFSQADWHFDEYWTLTLGARYTWEERRLTRNYKVPDLATLATTGDCSV